MVRARDAGDSCRLMSRRLTFTIPAFVAVVLLMAAASVAAATSTEVPRCNGVKLRTGPSTADTVRAVIDTTTTVTVDGQVSGSTWQSLCAGQVLSGSTWARISSVDGTTVASRWGVPYVYAASGLLVGVASPSPTASASAHPPTAPPTTPPTAPPASLAPPPTEAPTAAPATSTPSPSTPAPPSASPAASAAAGGPITNQNHPSDPINGSVAIVVLLLAVLSTALSWFAVADRRRRRSRRAAVADSVPASRLEDVLH